MDALGNRLTYDAEGRIVTVYAFSNPCNSNNPASNTYVYDASSSRVAKTGGTPTDYIYFGGTQLARFSGGQWTDLIYGTGGLLAEVAGTQTSTPVYRMLDYLGTQAGTLSSTGAVLSLSDHAPFGQLFTGGSQDPYQFTGKERDAESGNDYFGARFYASSMGRFTSPDWSESPVPIAYADLTNPQTLNLYGYTGNNPLSYIDPMGHVPCSGVASITIIVTPDGAGPPVQSADDCPRSSDLIDLSFRQMTRLLAPPQKPTPVQPQIQRNAPNNGLKQQICNALPSGRTVGVSGGLGGVGSVGGGGDLVINYNSGQVSAFGFGGVQIGWNGGASGSAYSGFVYGLNDSNSNYSGGFTGVNGGAGFGGFAARSSGGLTGGAAGLIPTGGVTAAGLSVGGGLLGGFSGGVTATNYTNPFQFNSFFSAATLAGSPIDTLFFLAKQAACK